MSGANNVSVPTPSSPLDLGLALRRANRSARSADSTPSNTTSNCSTLTRLSSLDKTRVSTLLLGEDLTPTRMFRPDNLVTLDVGPDHQKIIVHKHYIARTSEFFAAALKETWTEGHTRTIPMPEEVPEHMEHYCDYLYSGKLPTQVITDRWADNRMEHAFTLLANLYVLGERRLDKVFRNAVVREMLRVRGVPIRMTISPRTYVPCNPLTATVNTLYHGTPEGSPARRLMVDIVIMSGEKDWHSSDVDPAFSFDVMQGFLAKVAEKRQFIAVNCRGELQAEDYLL
jgi:hypothetical protein